MAKFNIDEMKSGFEPLEIIFRGQDYVLGKNALGMIRACEIHGQIEGKDGMEYLAAFLGALPEVLEALCPGIPTDDLETGEQMALIQACTEVLGRIGQLSFPAEEQ